MISTILVTSKFEQISGYETSEDLNVHLLYHYFSIATVAGADSSLALNGYRVIFSLSVRSKKTKIQ